MVNLADRIIGIESGGNPYARNPRSSATGLGQFIDSTWIDMLSRYRPDLITGRARQDLLDMRTDPSLSREMTDAYARENAGFLSSQGLPVTPGTTYLAHFAGPQGAAKVLAADPATPVANILGLGVVKANPFLQNMTAGDLTAWADRKLGAGATPASPMAPVASAAPPMPAGPWSILTQEPESPLLSGAVRLASSFMGQNQPRASQGGQPPPLPMPAGLPARPVDLSQVKALAAPQLRGLLLGNIG